MASFTYQPGSRMPCPVKQSYLLKTEDTQAFIAEKNEELARQRNIKIEFT